MVIVVTMMKWCSFGGLVDSRVSGLVPSCWFGLEVFMITLVSCSLDLV